MKDYTIEKDVPIPLKGTEVDTPLKRTIKAMEVGDSVVLTGAEVNRAFGYRLKPKKFARRKIAENLYRLWRII